MNKRRKSIFCLTSAMVIFGTIGIFRKYIDLPSSMIAMVRGLIGALFLLLLLLCKRQPVDRRAIRKNALLLILSGIFIAFNWILLFESYRYTTIATATLCYYMAPVLIILAAPFLFGEKMTLKKIVCVLLAVIGIVLVSDSPGGESGTQNTVGILLGLGAAVLYAGVILMNKRISDIGAIDKTLVQLASAGIVMIPYLLLTEEITSISYTPQSVILLVLLAIVHTGFAYTLYFGAIEWLPAQTTAIFSYIDPVVAILLSTIIFNERMSIGGIIGAILILGATLIQEMPILQRKNSTPKGD